MDVNGNRNEKRLEITTLPAGLSFSYLLPYEFLLGSSIGVSNVLVHDRDNVLNKTFNSNF